MTSSLGKSKSVAILGAGPVGLAAAAHVLERGMEPVVLEAGPTAGHAVRQWRHVQLFSSWEYNVDRAAARLLDEVGGTGHSPIAIPPAVSCWSSISNRWHRGRDCRSVSAPAAW